MKNNSAFKLFIVILILLSLVVVLFLLILLLKVSSNDVNNNISITKDDDEMYNLTNTTNDKNQSDRKTNEIDENKDDKEEITDNNDDNDDNTSESISNDNQSVKIELEDIKYPKESKSITSIDPLLVSLKSNGMKFSSIKNELGEGKELEDGYISYLDGTVKIKKTNKNVVINIVFKRNYKQQIFSGISNTDTLDEIEFFFSDNCFGSVEEGFLGYRTDEMYYFIYDNEISVYGYSYTKNLNFEIALTKYIKDNDLENFVNTSIREFLEYDSYDCNFEEDKANIMFSCYGIEFKINGNGSKGIIIYNNYYFSLKMQQYVNDGIVTFKNSENSIEKVEKERRKLKVNS